VKGRHQQIAAPGTKVNQIITTAQWKVEIVDNDAVIDEEPHKKNQEAAALMMATNRRQLGETREIRWESSGSDRKKTNKQKRRVQVILWLPRVNNQIDPTKKGNFCFSLKSVQITIEQIDNLKLACFVKNCGDFSAEWKDKGNAENGVD